MPISLDPALVETMVSGLLGACDVDGGPTGEQVMVLEAIAELASGKPSGSSQSSV